MKLIVICVGLLLIWSFWLQRSVESPIRLGGRFVAVQEGMHGDWLLIDDALGSENFGFFPRSKRTAELFDVDDAFILYRTDVHWRSTYFSFAKELILILLETKLFMLYIWYISL